MVASATAEPITIPGLHKQVFELFTRHTSPGQRVLDLGAGQGAWAERLKRAGYEVVAVEQNREAFRVSGVPVVKADLNGDFASSVEGPFDVISAIEVIEHLENPRHLLRQVKRLLAPGGRVFITTPNVENTAARVRFLFTGEMRMFGLDPQLNDPTHITPIHTHMLTRMLRDAGLRLVEHGFNNRRATVTNPVFRVATTVLDPFVRGLKGGDCHIFVLGHED